MNTKALLKERGHVYGPTWFLTSLIIAALRKYNPTLLDDLMDDGVVFHNWFMILGKLMRLLKSPRHIDTWQDIAGYAQLVIDYIEKGDDNG